MSLSCRPVPNLPYARSGGSYHREDGNNYIFAPFGADGGVPAAGPLYFFGHPGMNNKGLAYVHHGGWRPNAFKEFKLQLIP
ncbi:MAG: hypothetical protein AAF633_03915 [Chloroflexota bacterium]